jgi:hypothetical protein
VPNVSIIYNDRVGKVKVNITLEQAMTAQRGIRRIALLFL